jgi:hypothetical protein
MQIGQRAYQRLSDLLACLRSEVARIGAASEHAPGNLGHHVERRPDDARICAQRQRLGDRHHGRPQRREDPELTDHVVRARQDMAERRPAQDVAWQG